MQLHLTNCIQETKRGQVRGESGSIYSVQVSYFIWKLRCKISRILHDQWLLHRRDFILTNLPNFQNSRKLFYNFCSGVEPSVQVTDVVHSSKTHCVLKHCCCTVLSCLLLRGVIIESLPFPLAAVFLAKFRCNVHLRREKSKNKTNQAHNITMPLKIVLAGNYT